ncbi:MAG: aminoglycoside phosphotransferase family protein [Acidobacteriota bacterium]|nr:aminoglycoside phosphotransferase family protein [Acidobacteriota bacterium]
MNTNLMRDVFASELFPTEKQRAHYQINGCEIIQARYKPGKNCLLSYRLKIVERETGKNFEQILCARVYESGGSQSRFDKAQAQSKTHSRSDNSIFHLPDLDMVGWVFPNDRKLTALSKLADETCLKQEILPPVIATSFGQAWQIESLTNDIIHYVAEHTCTVRACVGLKHSSGGEKQVATLFGKTYYNHDGAETFARMLELAESAACLSGRLTLAQPLAYQPEIQTLWQMGLPGDSLYEHQNDLRFFALLERAAISLAALHQTSTGCSRQVGVADLLARFDEVERMVEMLQPASLPKLRSLLDRLKNQARQIGARPAATLHGDLHLKNFLVTGQQVALIDLDNLSVGDPLLELGSFIASLLYRNLAQAKPVAESRKLADAFVRAYAESVSWPLNDSILDWYIAATMIAERAYRCVTRLKSERPTLLDEIIALADQICARKHFVAAPSFIAMF